NNNLTKNSNNNDQYETLSSENHQHRLINIDNNNNNNDFCNENYIDSAYFNGYDTIITRGNNLWYYYKDRRNRHLSRSFDQRRFTQGDYIQGAFNISRTPLYCLNNHEKQRRQIRQSSLMDQSIGLYSTNRLSNIDQQQRRQRQKSMPLRSKSTVADHLNQQRSSGQQSQTVTGHCEELQKLRSTAIYFLHNKQHQRSYYNLDVRYPNGTQRRVRSRDLPWNMKQVGLLTGNLWPNGWELYQQFRPVAFLPSRFEMIFILNEHNFDQELSILNLYGDNEQQQRFQSKRLINNNNKNQTENFVQKSPILIWNNLDAINWNQSWRTKLLDFEPPVRFTGMFEMNGIVYAIGEQIHSNSVRRIGKMYQYYVTDNDGRNFKELNQTVQEFFVFLRNSSAKISSSQSTINKSIRNDNQPLGSSSPNSGSNVVRGTTLLFPKLATAGSSYPTVTLRETDSIMLTILIAIVIGASILCIILACLVINEMDRINTLTP
ncbi:hypothetical protein DERP_012358, partial [Dermatophagoides pteronyssinus]